MAATVNDMRNAAAVEDLAIRHGNHQYQETVSFHTYATYRHGKHQIQTASVGYSSEGDLVLYQEDYATVSESEMGLQRRGKQISDAVCLNPQAKRPLTDVEELLPKNKIKGNRFKKYPGIKCPKNRKLRNRLINDHFACGMARQLYEAHFRRKHGAGDGDASGCDSDDAVEPAFPMLPESVHGFVVHVDEEKHRKELEKRGLALDGTTLTTKEEVDPNSGEARFSALNSRLKEELKNALGSEFLTQQIMDLEAYFAEYITRYAPTSPTTSNTAGGSPPPMIFVFRDGYGRLVCHGVAAYYLLNSASATADDGTRQTIVTLPSKAKGKAAGGMELPHTTLLTVLQRRQGRSPVLSGAPCPLVPQTDLFDSVENVVVYDEDHVNAALQKAKESQMTATQRKKLRKMQNAAQ